MKYNDSLVKYYLSDSKGPGSKVTFDDVSLSVLDGYDKYTVEDSVIFKITKFFFSLLDVANKKSMERCIVI